MDGWNSNIYPKARFISEYGFQSIPSIHSFNQYMNANDKLDDLITHRQHFPYGSLPIINLISRHLPLPRTTDANYWNSFIYFSQISQAMTTKIETETYRFAIQSFAIQHFGIEFNFLDCISRVGRYFDWKTMGALYWQLNDVWTAPSWSSIEHNGNFKILHHWAKNFFAPVHVVGNIDALNNLNVFVIRDTLGSIQPLILYLRIYNWSSLSPIYQQSFNIPMVGFSCELKKNAILKIRLLFSLQTLLNELFIKMSKITSPMERLL